MQRQVLAAPAVKETVEAPQAQCIDSAMGIPVQKVQRSVEIPQVQSQGCRHTRCGSTTDSYDSEISEDGRSATDAVH